MHAPGAENLLQEAQGFSQRCADLRRSIHQNPELSFEERETARLIARTLVGLGWACREGVGGTGVIGVLEGTGPGRTVALRADMDALPVEEETGLFFASRNPGVMHACGHDAHVACALGAAMLLAARRERFAGRVKVIFQPAEEIDLGAKAVIRDRGLEDPEPDAVYGLHCNPEIPVGKVGFRSGPIMAAIDNFTLTVLGRGGHGAYPHQCRDAVVAACAMVMSLQTLVSRTVDPLKPAVFSVGSFHAGQANNIIAPRAELEGTVRCVDPDVHAQLPTAVERICGNTGAAFGVEASLNYQRMLPPLVNTPEMAALVREAVEALLGSGGLVDIAPSMGGDDFAFYLEKMPGAYIHLGVKPPGQQEGVGLHNGGFDIDEGCLPLGAALLAHLALSTLANP